MKPAKKSVPQKEKKRRFFALVRHPKGPTDHWDAWQIEVVVFTGNEFTHRYFYDKKDAKRMVVAKLELINTVSEAVFEKYES